MKKYIIKQLLTFYVFKFIFLAVNSFVHSNHSDIFKIIDKFKIIIRASKYPQT